MRKKLITGGLLGCLLFSLAAFFSPDPLKEKITQALDRWRANYPQEKVYLQFDKDYYAAGEIIWFAGYITADHLPTDYSTNLYVELIDKKGKVLQRNILPIIQGTAGGDFELPQDFPPGDYRIRAYTAWMLNFDPAFLFEKDIRVFDPLAPATQHTPRADTGVFAVQFFPEGGDLVEGIKSTVAFKAIGADGLPVTVTGRVTDGSGDSVAAIRCLHDGMGSFELTPQPGARYHAIVKTEYGAGSDFPLPAAKDTGIVLHINSTANQKIFFQVRPSPHLPMRYNELKLVAQYQGHLVYYNTIDFSKGLSGGMMPTGKLPSGILQLTVFRSDGLPLAERLVFLKNDDILQPTLQAMRLDMDLRAKNTFRITVPDTLTGRFSVSVTDADQVSAAPYADNIVSDLLLTSDIKGNVYRPGWYFANNDDTTLQALDLVMMTNGWRRFSWTELLEGRHPAIQYPPELDHLWFHGKAFERKEALQNGKMQMMVKAPADTLTYFINADVNKNGYFEVQGLSFHDTAALYYKGVDTLRKGRDVQAAMAAPFTNRLDFVLLGHPIRPYEHITSPQKLAGYLQLSQERNHIYDLISRRSILLKEVDVRASRITREEKMEDRYTSGLFKSDNGYTFDLTGKQVPYTSIFQYLQGRVAGLRIYGNPYANPIVRWRGGRPGFFLDEIPVDAATLATVPVSDIALVKVFRPPFMGGFGGANGAIAVYTKRGGDNDDDLLRRGFEKIYVPGYTLTRQFYSPDFSVKKEINELPDKRVTLYWDPSVVTDSTHTATFSFYNTDITHRIRIVLEGMDSKGNPGRIEKVFPE